MRRQLQALIILSLLLLSCTKKQSSIDEPLEDEILHVTGNRLVAGPVPFPSNEMLKVVVLGPDELPGWTWISHHPEGCAEMVRYSAEKFTLEWAKHLGQCQVKAPLEIISAHLNRKAKGLMGTIVSEKAEMIRVASRPNGDVFLHLFLTRERKSQKPKISIELPDVDIEICFFSTLGGIKSYRCRAKKNERVGDEDAFFFRPGPSVEEANKILSDLAEGHVDWNEAKKSLETLNIRETVKLLSWLEKDQQTCKNRILRAFKPKIFYNDSAPMVLSGVVTFCSSRL